MGFTDDFFNNVETANFREVRNPLEEPQQMRMSDITPKLAEIGIELSVLNAMQTKLVEALKQALMERQPIRNSAPEKAFTLADMGIRLVEPSRESMSLVEQMNRSEPTADNAHKGTSSTRAEPHQLEKFRTPLNAGASDSTGTKHPSACKIRLDLRGVIHEKPAFSNEPFAAVSAVNPICVFQEADGDDVVRSLRCYQADSSLVLFNHDLSRMTLKTFVTGGQINVQWTSGAKSYYINFADWTMRPGEILMRVLQAGQVTENIFLSSTPSRTPPQNSALETGLSRAEKAPETSFFSAPFPLPTFGSAVPSSSPPGRQPTPSTPSPFSFGSNKLGNTNLGTLADPPVHTFDRFSLSSSPDASNPLSGFTFGLAKSEEPAFGGWATLITAPLAPISTRATIGFAAPPPAVSTVASSPAGSKNVAGDDERGADADGVKCTAQTKGQVEKLREAFEEGLISLSTRKTSAKATPKVERSSSVAQPRVLFERPDTVAEELSVLSSSDSVEILKAEEASEADVSRARELMLPDHFFLLESRGSRCEGCRGCEADAGEESLVSAEHEGTLEPGTVSQNESPQITRKAGSISAEKVSPVDFEPLTETPEEALSFSSTSSITGDSNSTAQTDEAARANTMTDEVGQSRDIHSEPLTPMLERITVETEKGRDEVLYNQRAALYVYDPETREARERAIGDAKILRGSDGRAQIVLQRETDHGVVCSHHITGGLHLEPLATDTNIITWSAAESNEHFVTNRRFGLKFDSGTRLNDFTRIVEDEVKKVRKVEEGEYPERDERPSEVVEDLELFEIVECDSEGIVTTRTEAKEAGGREEDVYSYGEDFEEAFDSDSYYCVDDVLFTAMVTYSEEVPIGGNQWTNLGPGRLRVFYDDHIFSYVIHLSDEKTEIGFAETIITAQTSLETKGLDAIWMAMDTKQKPAVQRRFCAKFTSEGDLRDFAIVFLEGRELAEQGGIAEKCDQPPCA